MGCWNNSWRPEKISRVSKMMWIYLLRPLNHVHCVMPKRFRVQVQACLDKAQLSSHYSSGHSVMKKQIICLAEAQQGSSFVVMLPQGLV